MSETQTDAPVGPRTLAVDIGGTGIKEVVIGAADETLTKRERVLTPKPPTPEAIIDVICDMAKRQGEFDRVSVGFPGVVRHGVTETAPNLDQTWRGFPLAQTLSDRLGKPVRVANDADVQGFGAISGNGVEMVLTLGTGLGSALFVDGRLVPNLELAHHRFRAKRTYEQHLGKAALEQIGKKKWNKYLRKAMTELHKCFNYDYLYLGGGNASKVNGDLPPNVKIVSNVLGLLGGIALWRD